MFVLHIPNTQLKLSLEVNVSKKTSITTSQIIVLHLPKLLPMEISHNILRQFKYLESLSLNIELGRTKGTGITLAKRNQLHLINYFKEVS